MAFIRYEDDVPAEHRVPDTDNILRIHGVHPAVISRHYELYMELMHRQSPLSRTQREMIAVVVSGINRCRY